jgi:hypothetical protein
MQHYFKRRRWQLLARDYTVQSWSTNSRAVMRNQERVGDVSAFFNSRFAMEIFFAAEGV